MRRLAALALMLFPVAAPMADAACDCGGCPPTSCGTTSTTGAGILAVRSFGQRGPLTAYAVANGRRRFSLPPGILSANGRRYVALRATGRRSAVVRTFDARTGRVLRTWRVGRGRWFLGGVSANGRVIALINQTPHATRVALVDPRGGELGRLALPRWYDVDAVSNDGRRVFLIQYLRSGSYLIRRYDAARRSLAAQPLTEKGAPMSGTAWDAVASPDGHRLLTLYLRASNRPEVHALDLVRGTAVCIDLPRGDAWSVQQYTLALSPNGRTLYAANPALGIVATIDLVRQRVARVVRFLIDPDTATLAPSAVTSHDGRTVYFTAGRLLFAYDAAYRVVRGPYDAGIDVGGIAFDAHDRTLLVVGRGGLTARLSAATGRRL